MTPTQRVSDCSQQASRAWVWCGQDGGVDGGVWVWAGWWGGRRCVGVGRMVGWMEVCGCGQDGGVDGGVCVGRMVGWTEVCGYGQDGGVDGEADIVTFAQY